MPSFTKASKVTFVILSGLTTQHPVQRIFSEESPVPHSPKIWPPYNLLPVKCEDEILVLKNKLPNVAFCPVGGNTKLTRRSEPRTNDTHRSGTAIVS